MRINKPGGGHITIPDDDPRAIKIREGYRPICTDKGVEVEKKKLTIEELIEKVESIEDIKVVLRLMSKQ